MLGAAASRGVARLVGRRTMSFPLSSLPPSFHVVKLVAPSSWMTPFRPLALITVGQSHRCQSALSVCRTFVDRKQIRHEKNLTYTTISHNVVHEGSSRTLLTRTSSRLLVQGSRDMSTSDNVREILYESPSISTLQNLAMGSVAQAAICCVVGGLLTFHPAVGADSMTHLLTLGLRQPQVHGCQGGLCKARAHSSLSRSSEFPGCLSQQARACGVAIAGVSGEERREVERVGVDGGRFADQHEGEDGGIGDEILSDEIEIDVMSFPSGVTVHRVPAKE
eukprot:757282-Hanusia_phi.AAC.2